MEKIVIAPDSFKDSLSAVEVCGIVRDAARAVFPGVEVVACPMGDGGEGTVEAVVAATGAPLVSVDVSGPLGNSVRARYARLGGDGALCEMSSASGLELLVPSDRNPMITSTYGTGQLVSAVLEAGVRELVIGIGGSATVDGGAGMACALGYRMLDARGKEIAPGGGELGKLERIDATGVHPALTKLSVKVACDVTNPLLGPHGAARVYGPQKGATPAMVEALEAGLGNLRRCLHECGLLKEDLPGDGAAGGLGMGLRAFCGATLERGATLVAGAVGLEKHLQGADLMVTGEGRTDAQTSSGKLCAVVARMASRAGVPTLLLSGAVQGDFSGMFQRVYAISEGEPNLDAALRNARENLYRTAVSALQNGWG